jgi:PRC-barrel domain protein
VTEESAAVPPSLAEAIGWTGFDLDDAGGARVGRVHSVFADAAGDQPVWLIVALGRRGAKKVAVPVRECAAASGRVWTAQGRAALGDAPAVDPTRPLLREHEIAICAHYGIGEAVGRHAEVAGRTEGSVTAQPASS